MNIYLHIGYPKTATTFLQKKIFPCHPAIADWNPRKPQYQWLESIIRQHDFAFDASAIRARVEAMAAEEAATTIVISREILVGDAYGGGRDSRIIADRLHSVFPDAQIIITLRNQLDMIDSLYRQYVCQGGGCRFEQFLNLSSKLIFFDLDYLFYARLICYYQALFGADAILVCLYEVFKESPQTFLDDLWIFMSVKPLEVPPSAFKSEVNKGMSCPSLWIARFLNRITYSPDFHPDAIVPIPTNIHRQLLQRGLDPLLFHRFFGQKSFMTQTLRAELVDYYRESNRVLQTMVNVSLEEYGYPL
ncbi:MAG: hypothetical protein R3A44_16245 [Caldilineaceae bacterium]